MTSRRSSATTIAVVDGQPSPGADRHALLTVIDVAAHLQVHRRTVLDLIASGDLRAINIGGARAHGARWRVRPLDLEDFVSARASRR